MMCRIPKPESGHRLIAVLDTFLRIWGRLRRPITRNWSADNRCEESWGTRTRYT